ncbi:MAG: iron ABC transporter ATP-binding protein [Treponema sp.]|nr:MAG: iron ABC transporter ATP-binding protein [Treponema sp.]
MNAICADKLYLGYEKKEVVHNFSAKFCKGKIISIIGPNGSGKSTILKSFARLLKINDGKVLLCNTDIASLPKKEFAQQVAILLQHNIAPEDLSVRRLIYFGRTPHKKWYEIRSEEDEAIIDEVLKQTDLIDFAEKRVCNLSGGERQRVWLAMALAQQPSVLLLDEPTTYLDIGYQLELLDLIFCLNKSTGLTIIMVLHDLNQAAQYSDEVIVLQEGTLFKHGTPREIFTEDLIKTIYNIDCKIIYDEEKKYPIILPHRKCNVAN